MKMIPLTQGKFALVSDKDYSELIKHKWCIIAKKYAGRKLNGRTVYMHKEIIRTSSEVDHKNNNTLDNQRSNLRICTHSENGKNRSPNVSSKSKFKGVDFQSRTNTWRARIKVNYKSIYLGDYITEITAAIAYNNAAQEYHGKYAKLNEV